VRDVKRVLVTLTVGSALMLGAGPASASAAFNSSTTFSGTNSVTGSGAFVIEPATSNIITVDYVCTVSGTPATATRIFPTDGCVLYQGTSVVDVAPGIAAGSPTLATRDRARVDIAKGGELKVCWHVQALFVDGDDAENTGCATGLAPSVGGPA
jgi:hypothetical protein